MHREASSAPTLAMSPILRHSLPYMTYFTTGLSQSFPLQSGCRLRPTDPARLRSAFAVPAGYASGFRSLLFLVGSLGQLGLFRPAAFSLSSLATSSGFWANSNVKIASSGSCLSGNCGKGSSRDGYATLSCSGHVGKSMCTPRGGTWFQTERLAVPQETHMHALAKERCDLISPNACRAARWADAQCQAWPAQYM